jgi:hypothetical protein
MIAALLPAATARAQAGPNYQATYEAIFQQLQRAAATTSGHARAVQLQQELNQLQLQQAQWLSSGAGSGSGAATPLTPYSTFFWNQGPGGFVRVTCTNNPTSEGTAAAAQLAAIPAGQRVVLLWQSTGLFWSRDFLPGTNIQSPWMVNGSTYASTWMTSFCAAVKGANAAIDFVVDDDEGNLSLWGGSQANISAIAADPRFSVIAQAYGLSNVSQVENLSYYLTVGQAWNAAIAGVINGYFHSGLYTPLNAAFPGAGFSNFANFVVPQAQNENVRDLNGWPYWYPEPLAGSHQAPAFYGQIGQITTRNDGSHPNFAASFMPTLNWEATVARVVGAGSGHPSVPWFSYRGYTNYMKTGPGYAESIYHVLMALGSTNIFLWNPTPATTADNRAALTALANLQSELGGATSWKVLTTSPVPFSSPSITTTIQIGTKTISRVTTAAGGQWVVTGN